MDSQHAIPNSLETGRLASFAQWVKAICTDPAKRKTALSMFDQAVISGAGFATSIIIGRFGSKEQLGVYFLAFTVILIARGVQAELVTAPYTIFLQRFRKTRAALYSGSILMHQLVVLVAAGLLSLIVAVGYSASRGVDGYAPTFWVLTVASPVLLFREFVRQYCFSRMDVVSATILDVLATATQLTGLYFLWSQSDLTAPSIYVVLALANSWSIAIWVWGLHKSVKIDKRLVVGHWWKNWSFAKWALASQVVCSCIPFVMPWVLAIYHDEATAGVGAACATLIGLSHVFTTAVANLLTPRAAKAFSNDGAPVATSTIWMPRLTYASVLGAFCIVVWFGGELLMQLVYGGKYAGYGVACFLLALAGLLNSMSVVTGNGLWALHRPQSNLIGDGATLVATFLAAAAFAPAHGVTGAALATLLGVLCGTAVRAGTFFFELRGAVKAGVKHE